MPAITVPKTRVMTGPGYLFRAPVGTAVPTNTVAGSVFTDAWAAAWVPIGVTEEGHEFTWSPETDNVTVAEYLAPLRIVTTSVEGKVSFAMAEFTANNLKFALNGGSLTTVSGTGATTLSKLEPPAVGAEIRHMIGWESEDSTERAVYYQCFQSGEVTVAHKPGSDKALIEVEFGIEQPATGAPFSRWYAGTVAVGAA